MLGAPHTTTFADVIAILSLMALGLDARTMINKSAFPGPLGSFLTWAGAVPILPVACNHRSKFITFGPTIMPSTDYEADLACVLRFVHEHGRARQVERLLKPLRDRADREPPSTAA